MEIYNDIYETDQIDVNHIYTVCIHTKKLLPVQCLSSLCRALNTSCRCLSEVRQFFLIFQCFEDKRQQIWKLSCFQLENLSYKLS